MEKLINRFSKQDGELFDTITLDRALYSLQNTYEDISIIKKELLAGRQVQTCFMIYKLEGSEIPNNCSLETGGKDGA